MAWFARIDRRLWADAKFRELTSDSKLLWFYLLTGPELSPLPGVVVAGPGQIIEVLSWDHEDAAAGARSKRPAERSGKRFAKRFGGGFRAGSDVVAERFRAGFEQLAQRGMVQHDWGARLIWLPRATVYTKPANPNQVKSWIPFWDAVPECRLKLVIHQHLVGWLEQYGRQYAEPFQTCSPNGSPNGSGGGSGRVPPLETETETEKNTPPTPQGGRRGGSARRGKRPNPALEYDPAVHGEGGDT